MLRGGVVLAIVLGAGWALTDAPVSWPDWLLGPIAALSPVVTPKLTRPVEPAALYAPLAPLTPASSTPASSTTDSTAGTASGADAPPMTIAALPPVGTGYTAPAAPSPPTADPYQKRAVAAGLHPELSRVLLAKLSSTDYRNAGIAIQTALAETPDTGFFVWSRPGKPELALFQVRFVPGATADCRRYVVTVTKDGWLTTALPMEKCGVQPRPAAARTSQQPKSRAD